MKGNFLTSMNGFPYGEPKVGNEIHPSWTTTFILLGRRRSSFLDDDVRDRGTMKGPITTDSIRLIPSSPAGKFRTPLPTFHLSGKPRRSTKSPSSIPFQHHPTAGQHGSTRPMLLRRDRMDHNRQDRHNRELSLYRLSAHLRFRLRLDEFPRLRG